MSTGFWQGKLARRIKGNADAQAMAFYLLTNPHGNMIGLYWMPLDYAVLDLGWTIERVTKAMVELFPGNRMEQSGSTSKVFQVDPGFVLYDFEHEWVFILEQARHEFGDDPNPDDKRNGSLWRCLRSSLEESIESSTGAAFLLRYGEPWRRIIHKSGFWSDSFRRLSENILEQSGSASKVFPSDPDSDSEKDPGSGEGDGESEGIGAADAAGATAPSVSSDEISDPQPKSEKKKTTEATADRSVEEDTSGNAKAAATTVRRRGAGGGKTSSAAPTPSKELAAAQLLGDLLSQSETATLAATIRANCHALELDSYRGRKFDEPARRIERTALYAELYFRLRETDGDHPLTVLRLWRVAARQKIRKKLSANWCSDVAALRKLLTEHDPLRLREGLELAAERGWMTFEWRFVDSTNGEGDGRGGSGNYSGKRDVEADAERDWQAPASEDYMANQDRDPEAGELYDPPGSWSSEIAAAEAARADTEE